MRSNAVFLLSLLGTSAWAAPDAKYLFKKAVCNADNCLRAVRATSAAPFPSSATADCSSFMRKTVTPCATTTTTTKTATATASPTYVTVTSVVDITQVNTVLETLLTVVTTIEDTATIVQPTEIDITNFIISPTTVTAALVNKRDLVTPPLPAIPTIPAKVQARVVSSSAAAPATCAATTNAATAVPSYASACSGTVRYSSACSCAGATGSTTTLAQSTVTATTTATVYTTPTSTVTLPVTNIVPVAITQTNFVRTVFETTDATVIVPSAYTVTTNVVVPTTVVVSPPVCSSYRFVVTDGPRAGQFLGANDPASSNTVSYAFVFFTDASNAKSWIVRPDSSVYSSQNVFGWVTRNNALYYVLEMTDYSQSQYRINYVKCAISQGGTSYTGAVGMLTCTTDAGTPTNLVSCVNQGNNLLQAPNVAGAGNGCYAVNFAAIPSC